MPTPEEMLLDELQGNKSLYDFITTFQSGIKKACGVDALTIRTDSPKPVSITCHLLAELEYELTRLHDGNYFEEVVREVEREVSE